MKDGGWIKVGTEIWDMIHRCPGKVHQLDRQGPDLHVIYTEIVRNITLIAYADSCVPLGCMIVMDEEKIYG